MDNISEKLNLRFIKKALELKRLNHAVKISLPVDCHDHMEVADVRSNQLIILTDSPVWQTRLRMYSQTILEALHQHAGVKLTRVTLKLIPPKRIVKEKSPVFRTLSEDNANLIEQTANCISDPALQAALLQLSRKTKKP
ncbi:MAG: hypothetical protein DIZ80_14595 [endosymbiont of Galathealinum brachiosum]|uniref:DUF721 domain-containing protein n=1 Tax=endosymbiont of Galathealinum brachiosum TaxID=2200906 RepID=A0A370D8V9_9GAMM|nr:MAG: hypothetical protein DIZ80_14595 [endosymbiont of Galathealinum brachiosum]